MTAKTLPTMEEINPSPECLDGQAAVKDFLSRTLEEAEEMFRQNSGHAWESLCYLGPVAFRFYVPAAIEYLYQELPNTHPPTISWFVYVIESWLEDRSNDLKPLASSLSVLFAEYLSRYSRFEEYDALVVWAAEHLRTNPIIPAEALAIIEEARDAEVGLRALMVKVQLEVSKLC